MRAAILFVTTILALPIPPAPAFEIPERVRQTNTASPTPPSDKKFFNVDFRGNELDHAPDCTDKSKCRQFFRDWREMARKKAVAKRASLYPSSENGASCIRSEPAFDVTRVSDTSYTVNCLAQRSSRLTHLLTYEMDVSTNDCLSDSVIDNFVGSATSTTKEAANDFLQNTLKRCGFIVTPRQAPKAYPMDVEWFNQLLNNHPAIGIIVDEERRVKTGQASDPATEESDPGIAARGNPLGDYPGKSNRRAD